MKKIFTLLFFVAVMVFSANAEDSAVEKCINVVLGNETETMITATNLDVNHDGIIDVSDVTMLIQAKLEAEGNAPARAPQIDVDRIINDALKSNTNEPNISDVNEAVDANLRNK